MKKLAKFGLILVLLSLPLFYRFYNGSDSKVLAFPSGPIAIPNSFKFSAKLNTSAVNGEITVYAKNKMSRFEFEGVSLNQVVIHRDGFSFTISPVQKVTNEKQNGPEWRFESASNWVFLRKDIYKEKTVDVYLHNSFAAGEYYSSEIFYDPELQFPVKFVYSGGGGWELTSLELKEQDGSLFIPPSSLLSKISSPPFKLVCNVGESSACSKGWSCGDPCPGGNCC